MFVLRLGGVSLPDCILKGLTAGAAFQIFSSLAKDFVGVRLPPVDGYFKVFKVNSVDSLFNPHPHEIIF